MSPYSAFLKASFRNPSLLLFPSIFLPYTTKSLQYSFTCVERRRMKMTPNELLDMCFSHSGI